jgi:hypothetical protein
MTLNILDKDNFDEILARSLKRHSEPVPSDFTERMMSRVKEAQEQRILARVVLQERLALAGSIMLGAAVIILAIVFSGPITAVFKGIGSSLTGQEQAFFDGVPRFIRAARSGWQFYIVFAGVFGFIVYSLVDLLVADGK